MKQLLRILILMMVTHATTVAQTGLVNTAGARGVSIGYISTVLTDVNAVLGNQAGITSLEKAGFVLMAENRFLLSELSHLQCGAVWPSPWGHWGISVEQFGFTRYVEQQIGLSYARKFSAKFSAAAQFDYLRLRIPDYGSAGFFNFEIGFLLKVLNKLDMGAHLYNPLPTSLTAVDTRTGSIAMGLAYHPSDRASLMAEIEKDILYPPTVKAGIEYYPVPILAIRAGFQTQPAVFTIGMGIQIGKSWAVDAGSGYDPVLGPSPVFSIRTHAPKR